LLFADERNHGIDPLVADPRDACHRPEVPESLLGTIANGVGERCVGELVGP